MIRPAGNVLLRSILEPVANTVTGPFDFSMTSPQRAERSVDYVFVIDAAENGGGLDEVVTKPGWEFYLTGLSWWAENSAVDPLVKVEQLESSIGQLSGGNIGEFVGMAPAACSFGGLDNYLEEPRDFMRYCGERAYLRATVQNKGPATKIYVLATGFEKVVS